MQDREMDLLEWVTKHTLEEIKEKWGSKVETVVQTEKGKKMRDRLISAKHVYELMDKFEDDAPLSYGKNIVKNAPTVDAVEVVLCKDCKKWETINCPFARDFVKWDGFKFCAWGERREDEADRRR